MWFLSDDKEGERLATVNQANVLEMPWAKNALSVEFRPAQLMFSALINQRFRESMKRMFPGDKGNAMLCLNSHFIYINERGFESNNYGWLIVTLIFVK